MSSKILLEKIIEQKKTDYGDIEEDSDVFEIFTAETILKRYGLSLDEISAGIVDGTDDGGIDSCYIFLNRSLLSIDTDLDSFKSPVEIDVYIIQSKHEKSFKEKIINSLVTSLAALMPLDADDVELRKVYNPEVCEKFEEYRKSHTELASQFPKLQVHICYATLADEANDKIKARGKTLKKNIEGICPQSTCSVEFWGADRIYNEASKQSILVKKLSIVKSPISHDCGFVALTNLKDYYDFITEDGELLDRLFEFNIRDYQTGVQVNKEIAASLDKKNDPVDFWWLNNGVTMIAEEASHQGGDLIVKNPLVVNGLQTSHEVYRFFKNSGENSDSRSLQVRVLQISEDVPRDRVIKATNSQTAIKLASLHATEPFQRKIEDYLQPFDIFYDRRKNYWRNKGKPANKIIGIDKMAQAIIAISLGRPHDARARPTSLLKDDKLYKEIFCEDHSLDFYRNCARIYFRVDQYWKTNRKVIQSIYRNNLRFHTMMVLSWEINGSKNLNTKGIPSLNTKSIEDKIVKKAFEYVQNIFDDTGAEDKTSKDKEFTVQISNQY